MVAHHDRAADHVGVPAEVLGRGVHHDVGAEPERLLEVRRGEGVVDDEQRARVVGDRASASMSPMLSSGLVGVSTQTILVLPGRSPRATASRSVIGAELLSRPQLSTLSKSRKVPPYASSGITTWSPGASAPAGMVSSAARPLANANPRSPSSSAASAPSSAVRVGLAVRLYS